MTKKAIAKGPYGGSDRAEIAHYNLHIKRAILC